MTATTKLLHMTKQMQRTLNEVPNGEREELFLSVAVSLGHCFCDSAEPQAIPRSSARLLNLQREMINVLVDLKEERAVG